MSILDYRSRTESKYRYSPKISGLDSKEYFLRSFCFKIFSDIPVSSKNTVEYVY